MSGAQTPATHPSPTPAYLPIMSRARARTTPPPNHAPEVWPWWKRETRRIWRGRALGSGRRARQHACGGVRNSLGEPRRLNFWVDIWVRGDGVVAKRGGYLRWANRWREGGARGGRWVEKGVWCCGWNRGWGWGGMGRSAGGRSLVTMLGIQDRGRCFLGDFIQGGQ